MTSGETTIFVYDAGNKLVAEYSTNVLPTGTAQVNYLTTDHLGTPRINTDKSGGVTSRHDYMPYGEEIGAVGGRTTSLKYNPDFVRQGFTGYQDDRGEAGLDFAEARDYSSGIGRFYSADRATNDVRITDPQSWDRYEYVRNNPLKFVDRNGRELFIVVNGKTYKVEATNKGYKLQGNDGSDKLVNASESMINRLAGGFRNDVTKLLASTTLNTLNVDAETSSPNFKPTANYDDQGRATSTDGTVSISGDNNESFLPFATDLLYEELLGESGPYLQHSQAENSEEHNLETEMQGNIPNAVLEADKRYMDQEDRVRQIFHFDLINRDWGRFNVVFDTGSNPLGEGSGRDLSTQGTGALRAPRADAGVPLPPPPPRKTH